jgi:methionyl-tRNA formyltransferase
LSALRSVFFGTPEFAVPILRALAGATDLRLVVTQPDRPSGRGRRPEPPAVALAARELGITVIQPERVAGRAFAAGIREVGPDLLVTAAFGRLLGSSLLAAPRLECLNVHASLLPAFRGAAPIARAILDGATATGVSIMRMAAELDAGPVFCREVVAIGPDETTGELTTRLAEAGAAALIGLVGGLPGIEPEEQDHARATWAPALDKAEGRMVWERSAAALHAHVRGMHPWPGAFTILGDQPLKVHRAAVAEREGAFGLAGTVLAHSSAGLDVACGEGVLRLLELQSPGRRRLGPAEFHAGRRVEAGTSLAT